MRGFIGDQRGVSAIVGLVLVIALVTVALAVHLMEQVPVDWKEAEYDTMQEVKQSFLGLRHAVQTLEPGQVETLKVRMGTPTVTAMMSSSTSANLKVVTARGVEDMRVDRYNDAYFSRTRAYDTYVDEANPGLNYTSSAYDNNHLYVSTTEGQRMRTYLAFDLRDSYRLYDDDANEFYDDAKIHGAQLLLFIEDVDLVEEPSEAWQIQPPLTAEVWWVENDAWNESITWTNQPHNPAVDEKLENTSIDGEDEWVAFDVTTLVKRCLRNIVENQARGWRVDNILSFVLREPEFTGTSSLRNLATFTSRDNRAGGYEFSPRLRLQYSRTGRLGTPRVGLIDFGSIEYLANNLYFPSQYYIYEGGMVIIQKDPGWYETILAEPTDFVVLTPADGNNVRLAVTRYQIEAGSVDGEMVGGTGYTSIRVQREGTNWGVETPASPNRSEVTITIRTDHRSAWRDYLKRLAAKVNYQLGGEWDTYGDHVKYDYDSVSLTIKGKNLDTTTQDIYYSECVVWLDTSLGYFHGGRT